jgi:hypothetical protein
VYTDWPLIQDFAGHFNGAFHTVSNFYLFTSGLNNHTDYKAKGFISSGTGEGSIENLIVQGRIESLNSGNVGGILGQALGSFRIVNVGSEVDISVSEGSGSTGGVVGTFMSSAASVEGCYYDGILESSQGAYHLGGIAGSGGGLGIRNSLNLGLISYRGTTPASTSNTTLGGICGTYLPLTNCVNTGSVVSAAVGDNTYVGGLLGFSSVPVPSYTDSYYLVGSAAKAIGATPATDPDPEGTSVLSVEELESYAFSGGTEYFEHAFLSYVEGDWPVLPFARTMRGAPVISSDSTSAGYVRDATTVTPLSITASLLTGHAFSDGELSYQWYVSTERSQSTATATLLQDAENPAYTPSVSTLGQSFYFCRVTNTWADGEEEAFSLSTPVLISVYAAGTTAGKVRITREPEHTDTEFLGEAALSLEAGVEGTKGTLSYQWYRNDGAVEDGATEADIRDGARPLYRATEASYELPTLVPGEAWYFCEVANTVAGILRDTEETALVRVSIAPRYSIASAEGLMGLDMVVAAYGSYLSDITVQLTQDIDLASVCGPTQGPGNTPLSFNSVTAPFSGHFDGGYHTISNYYVSRTAEDTTAGSGLFHSVTGGTIENLFLKGSISVNSPNAGALIDSVPSASGSSPVTVRNISVNVALTNSYNFGAATGGIIGRLASTGTAAATVTACANHGSVTSLVTSGYEYIGGIVGSATGGSHTISACYNSADITGGRNSSTVSLTGGIIGQLGAEVRGCYNSGTVKKAAGTQSFGPITGSATQIGPDTGNYYLNSSVAATAVFQPNITPVAIDLLEGESFPALLGPLFRYSAQGAPELFFEVGAGWPHITRQPQSARYTLGETAAALTVEATRPVAFYVGGQGTLSYQWYRSSTPGVLDSVGVVAEGASSPSFVPDSAAAGVVYYFCAVTNRYEGGEETVLSDIVTVAVLDGVPASPLITTQPEGLIMQEGTVSAQPLTVVATQETGPGKVAGTLAYQWYTNLSGLSPAFGIPAESDTLIEGATGPSINPTSSGASGDKTRYYYCLVSVCFGSIAASSVASEVAGITLMPSRIIATAADLLDFAREVNGTHASLPANSYAGRTVELAADLDLTSDPRAASWTPIGTGSYVNPGGYSRARSFNGIFEGGGHLITGLDYTGHFPTGYSGLFGTICGATIRNLVLTATVTYTVSEDSGSPGGIGLIASSDYRGDSGGAMVDGNSGSTFSNIEVDATIDISQDGALGPYKGMGIYLGVAAPSAYARFDKIVTRGSVTVTGRFVVGAAGVSGRSNSGADPVYTDCGNEASFTITSTSSDVQNYIAGLSTDHGSFTRCYNRGNITVASASTYLNQAVAGLNAYNVQWGRSSFSTCYNTGSVSGPSYVSGIVATTPYDSITRNQVLTGCYNTGTISSNASGAAGPLNSVVVSTSSSRNYYLTGCVAGTQASSATGEPKTAEEFADREFVELINGGTESYVQGTLSPLLVWEAPDTGLPVIQTLSTDPSPARLVVGGEVDTVRLSITATPPEDPGATGSDGTLGYQWYEGISALSKYGTKLEGERGSSFEWTPTTEDRPGYHYFYCVVTNTWTGEGGGSASLAATAFPVALVNERRLWTPVFAAEPEDIWYLQSSTDTAATALSVEINAPADSPEAAVGELSYQWYENTTRSTLGATLIRAAEEPSFAPPIVEFGSRFYFCEVTNTYDSFNSASATSSPVEVTVWSYAGAAPLLSSQPVSAQYLEGEAAAPLSVTAAKPASAPGSTGSLGYQWYYNRGSDPDTTADIRLSGQGADSPVYTPDTTLGIGTYYYYCVITNTVSIDNPASTHYPTTVTALARIALVSVLPVAKPVIEGSELADASYGQTETPAPLSITVGFGGLAVGFEDPPRLSYQWYASATGKPPVGDAPTPGDVKLAGATEASYAPPASSVLGTIWYYCIVTNTFEEVKTAATASALAALTREPLRLYTASELRAFADSITAGRNYNGVTVVLEADINLAGNAATDPWQAPGTSTRPFSGSFDGQGHTIAGFRGTGGGGLFGSVAALP